MLQDRTPRLFVALLLSAAALAPCPAQAQQPASGSGQGTAVQNASGIDTASGNTFAIIPVEGKLVTPSGIPIAVQADADAEPPRLTAQCSRLSNGKYVFELLADFGGLSENPYYKPWQPSETEKHPPHYQTVPVIMAFDGYMKVKPFKRQWQTLPRPAGQIRYDQPGGSSTNMESIVFFMKYLLALPTIRLTAGNKSAQWDTTDWQKKVHAEPLCQASGL